LNEWEVALLVYASLFVVSLSIAFMIDTLRGVIRRAMKGGR